MSTMTASDFDIPLTQRLRRADLRVLHMGPLAYTGSSLLHYGLRALVGKKTLRSNDIVSAEYDGATRREYWKSDLSNEDLILGDAVTPRWILVDNEPVVGTERQARMYLLDRLRTWVSKMLPSGRGRVVEFGCGTGRNLMFLAREFPELELVGLELTATTVARAREMASREGLNIRFESGDMTGDVSSLPSADLVFSIHALEQLPDKFPKAAENMLKLSKNLVLFEPIHELWPRNALSLASRLRVKNAGYLNGLYDYLKTRPGVTITHAEPQPTALNALNRGVELIVRAD